MSPSIRFGYLLLVITSLVLTWVGIQQMVQVPFGVPIGLLLVGGAMLIFAWVVIQVPGLVTAVDANSIHSKIARRLDPLFRAVLERPLLYSGVLAGVCAILVSPDPAFQPFPVLVLWVLGIVLFLVGAARAGAGNETQGIVADVRRWVEASRWELVAVLALTLFGLLVRGIALDAVPHNVHGDEGEMGMVARAVLAGELRNPFATAWLSHPTLWFFLQALALRLFGDDIGGLRMLSALLGTLAIPALYVWARPLYGRAAALIATALLAAYHFHLQYSRIGLNNIADALTITLILAAFFYACRTRTAFGFALTGVLMGVAQYFYFGARLAPLLVLALLAYMALWQRDRLRKLLRPLRFMAVGFFLTLGPLLLYFIARPDTFNARIVQQGLFQNGHLDMLPTNGQGLFAALMDHAYRSLSFFVAVKENSPFYGAEIPILDNGMAVLFIFGLVLVVINRRKIEMVTLPLWLGLTALLGGFLLIDPPQSQRYVITIPALCVLMALALVQIGSLLRQLVPLPMRFYTGAAAVVVVALMAWNLYFYFAVYTPRNSFARTNAVTEIGNYLRPQARQRYVYMFTPPFYFLRHGTIQFVGDKPEGMDVLEPLTSTADFPNPPAGLRPLFIFIPERLGELAIVKQRYPEGKLQEYRIQPGDDRTLMYIYEPSAQVQAQK